MHTDGLIKFPPVQIYPWIAPIQFELHPILSVLLPSSHVSKGVTFPSPQIGVHIEGDDGDPPVH